MLRETAYKSQLPDSSPQGGAGVAPLGRFQLAWSEPEGLAHRPTGPHVLFLRVLFHLRQVGEGMLQL